VNYKLLPETLVQIYSKKVTEHTCRSINNNSNLCQKLPRSTGKW